MARKVNATRGRNADSSIRDRAYRHIQRKIASGELEAGDAVSELALARELGSSRTPIREALGQLVAEGLLDQTPNRGAVVVQLNRQDIIDLYELREALEVYAAGKAARHRVRTEDLATLEKVAGEVLTLKEELDRSGKPALNAQQMHRFIGADLSFHALLMRMAANARILKVVNETRLLIRIFAMRHRGHESAELERIHRQHLDILDAVSEGDAERGMKLIAQHIQTSQRERLEEFDHMERQNSLRESVPAFFSMMAPTK